MKTSKLYKPLLVFLAVMLLVSVSWTQGRLNRKRGEMGLTRTNPLENAPPVLAFTTVALGGFRGLIANVLWLRLNDMQEQDKFFEMVQLADWISKLQPHFVTVWVHLAWNMSYNISVKFNDPQDRWMWVQRGIELLRDDGIRWNPNEPLLYRELAWHFQHKMGANLDDAHHYYKTQWAIEMSKALGSGRPNFDELINPTSDEAKARAKLLAEKFKIDPRRMKEVDERYGPLEWRLPEAHAIYWAYLGLEKAKHDKLKEKDLIALRRVIFQSMQLAFLRGRMIYPDKSSQEFTYGPNLEIIARTNEAYEEMMKHEPDMLQNIQNAHKNFLKIGVEYLYTHNRHTQAREWFDYLRKLYPDSVPPDKTLDDFALERVTEIVGETSHDKTKMVLEGLLSNYYIYLAIDEDDQAISYERFAQRVHARFMQEVGPRSEKRVGLPPLSLLKKEVLDRLLDPENGLATPVANQLRTKLGLPLETTPPAPASPPSPAPGSTNTPARPPANTRTEVK